MSSCEFTYEHYADILYRSTDEFVPSDFTQAPDSAPRIYFRHDVDVSLKNAVRMAEIESEYGVVSTYFVALNSPYYNLLNDTQLERVRRIAELGHTIGFHIDERGRYIDPYDSLEEMLESVYEFLSPIIPIEKVISFHMPSEYEFTTTTAIGDFVNAYSDRFNNDDSVKYLSDSGRRWREGCFHKHLDSPDHHSYQVLIHPVWWNETHLAPEELYQELQDANQEGLKVNLREDIQVFSEL
jgi:hypothetical protein